MGGAAARDVLALAALLAAGLAGEDWARFRGPNGSGVSDATGLPVEFGPAKNLLWKTAVPFARSSPVIGGDRIFVTAVEGDKLVTICLDRSSGRVRWRREIARPRATPIYKMNDSASPSPATDGSNVYVFFPDLGLISYTGEGRERWRLPLGPFDTFYGLGASPILSGDTVLLVCDTRTKPFLAAVDAASGRIRWRVERSEIRFEGYSTPIIHQPEKGPAQVIVLGAHRMDAYAVATGEKIWWVRGLAYFPVGSPVTGKGMVFFTTWGSDRPVGPAFEEWLKKDADGDGRLSREEARDFDEFGGVDRNRDGYIDRSEWDLLRNSGVGDYGLLAVRLGGRGDLTEAVAWRNKKTYDSITTPLIYDGVLYLVKSGGIIASLDPRNGEVFKIERTEEAMDPYYSSPVAADGKVYFTSESGKVTAVKAGAQWEILSVNELGEEVYATPAIGAGRLYVRTRNALYCFGKQ